jgi:excisionase family DNA binding protein
VTNLAMVAADPLGCRELSTPRFDRDAAAHNRAMAPASTPGSDPASSALGRFLTLADTAEVLNISASQAYALVRSGELPAIKIGGSGHWRVERDVLERYIAGKYEETRRHNLWNQAEFADIPELFVERER